MTESMRVFVVDDDCDFAASLARTLRSAGYEAEPFSDPGGLLEAYQADPADCVITDVMMGEVDGFAFAGRLRELDPCVGIIFVSGWPSTSAAVKAIREFGGVDYLEKPIVATELLLSVSEAASLGAGRRKARSRLAQLTAREMQVLALLERGHSTKEIARLLAISPRTVEDHRAQIGGKTGARTLAAMIALVRECQAAPARSIASAVEIDGKLTCV